jgi:hypothetical protein
MSLHHALHPIQTIIIHPAPTVVIHIYYRLLSKLDERFGLGV